jgi:N-acetylmuramoyl-L-alanine amidase
MGIILDRKKLALSLAFLFLLNIFLILLVNYTPKAQAILYVQGANGDSVRQIQGNLKSAGFYGGAVDGVYGPVTAAAIKAFQRDKKLPVSGDCGIRTLSELGLADLFGIPSPQNAGREYALDLLSRFISAEARNDSFENQVAVGNVILNRVADPAFPNTLAEVIYQPGAFESLRNGHFDKPTTNSAKKAARQAMKGLDLSGGALYYTTFTNGPQTDSEEQLHPVVRIIGRRQFTK